MKEKLALQTLKTKDAEAALKALEGKSKIELNKAKYTIKTLEANKEKDKKAVITQSGNILNSKRKSVSKVADKSESATEFKNMTESGTKKVIANLRDENKLLKESLIEM